MGLSHLPKSVASMLQVLLDLQFDLYLIGGAARAIVDNKNLPFDLDFEVRRDVLLTGKEWEEYLMNALSQVAEQFKCKLNSLKFGVHRIELNGYSLEFASPRIEHYQHDCWDHSNFTVELKSQMADSQAFRRRDFTFNAFAWRFSKDLVDKQLIDPFGGVSDWKNKKMTPCSDDFHRDPVRFLRAIRFSLQHQLVITPALFSQLRVCQLHRLTPFHFLSESSKVHFGAFVTNFLARVNELGIEVPEMLHQLIVFRDCPDLAKGLFVKAIEGEIDSVFFQQVVTYFMLGKKKFTKIWIQAETIRVDKINPDSLMIEKTWEKIWK